MLRIDRLPDFVFVDENGADSRVALREMTRRIRAIASHLTKEVAAGSVVGLMYESSPQLVLAWLGCLAAGLKPLVMQYPTRKQSRIYWEESIRNTVATTGLAVK